MGMIMRGSLGINMWRFLGLMGGLGIWIKFDVFSPDRPIAHYVGSFDVLLGLWSWTSHLILGSMAWLRSCSEAWSWSGTCWVAWLCRFESSLVSSMRTCIRELHPHVDPAAVAKRIMISEHRVVELHGLKMLPVFLKERVSVKDARAEVMVLAT